MDSMGVLGKTKGGNVTESAMIATLAAAGFIAWGLYVNWEHGMGSRIQVALTQGGISFIATLGSAELLRKISRNVKTLLRREPSGGP